jgi:hypothetical protein
MHEDEVIFATIFVKIKSGNTPILSKTLLYFEVASLRISKHTLSRSN